MPNLKKKIKIFILDTNVLLSDPNAIFSLDNNDVFIPFMVLEELDKHKRVIQIWQEMLESL